jgi:pimeloyl-ACP methyl ester carboxylesterase
MANPLVKLALALLRVVSHGALFLEAQRLAGRLVRPTSSAHLAATEATLLSGVSTPLSSHAAAAPDGLRTLSTPRGGDRPALVLLHGHSMSAAFYFRNFDDLARTHAVYAPDLLGWGRSSRPRPAARTPADAVEFYVASLAAWAGDLGLTEFVLLGHSLGAYIAFEFAKRYPAAVTSLVLISPAAIARELPLFRALYFSLPPQALIRRGGLMGYLLFMLCYPRSPAYTGPHRLREYTYHLAAQGPPSGETAVLPMVRFGRRRKGGGGGGGGCGGARRRGGLRLRLPLPAASIARPMLEALDPVACPVLLMCGETDSSIEVRDVHVLHREMKRRAFDVTFRVIEGADHCPHLECPDEFYAALRPFLDGKKRGVVDAAPSPPPRASSSNALVLDAGSG